MEMETVKKATVKTDLKVSIASAPVKLYKTKAGDPKARKWDTAGPNGHPLRVEMKPVGAEEEEKGDDAFGVTPVKEETPAVPEPVLASDPGPEGAPPAEEASDGPPTELKRVLVEEESGEEVAPDEIRKGIRLDDGDFVDLTDHLTEIEEESRVEGIEILGFIRREKVPRERIVDSYFLGAEGKASARLIRVLFESMKDTGRVAVVRWTKRKGQSLGILTPRGDGAMLVLELAYAEICRKPNAACLVHLQAEVSREMVEQTKAILEGMEWSVSELDEVRNRRVELEFDLVERAEAGKVEDYSSAEAERVVTDELAEILQSLVPKAA